MLYPPAKMTDYLTLLDQVRHCRLCAEQLPLGPRPVLQLHPAARLLIAGQAPGRKVHASGIPFEDASGARLRDWLGLDATQFYDPSLLAILPMGFCYPGTGPHGDLPPRPECAAHWRVQLLQQLPNLQLTLVLGQHALAWHLPDADNITQAVRNWQTGWPHILPLPHPSPRNNLWLKRNPWFAAEVLPALRQRVQQLLRMA